MNATAAEPDSAAIFACAISLWEECRNNANRDRSLDLSATYNGWDQLMREVMRIGRKFEEWACAHVCFDDFEGVWPYMLGDRFGSVFLEVLSPTELESFGERECLRVALRLGLQIREGKKLPIPIEVIAGNPVDEAGFLAFRIQTVRFSNAEGGHVPFTVNDDPFDERFSEPLFGIYGIEVSEKIEHIADRPTYLSAIELVRKLAPGIQLPTNPTAKSQW